MHHTRVIRAAEGQQTVGVSVCGRSRLLADMLATKVHAAGVNAAKTLLAYFVSIPMVKCGPILAVREEGLKDEALTSRGHWPAKPLQQQRRTSSRAAVRSLSTPAVSEPMHGFNFCQFPDRCSSSAWGELWEGWVRAWWSSHWLFDLANGLRKVTFELLSPSLRANSSSAVRGDAIYAVYWNNSVCLACEYGSRIRNARVFRCQRRGHSFAGCVYLGDVR
jgi:hypothetical protein